MYLHAQAVQRVYAPLGSGYAEVRDDFNDRACRQRLQ